MSRYTHMELAESYVSTGEFIYALEELTHHLTKNPIDDEALYLRAQVQLQLKHYPEAFQDLEQLTAKTPLHFLLVAKIHERLDDTYSAQQALKTAYELTANDERIAESYLLALLTNHEYDTALDLVLQQPHTWRWKKYHAEILMNMKKYGEAVLKLTQSLLLINKLSTKSVIIKAIEGHLVLLRARCYVELEQFEEAIQDLQQAKTLLHDPSIGFQEAIIAALQGDLEQAKALVLQTFQKTSSFVQQQFLDQIQQDPALYLLFEQLK
jgi:tetratricopeptide (TPR) repeat protein